MKVFQFILFFMLVSVKSLYSQPKQAILKEDFNDNRNNWWTGKTDNGSCDLKDSKYFIEYKKDKSWGPKIDVDINQDEDFVIESTITRLSGINENGYGLMWGKGNSGYFVFIITGGGKYYVRKVEKDKAPVYLIDWRKSNLINKDNSVNKLRIQKQNNVISFFVNDKFLDKLYFERFYGNQVGFMVYQNQSIQVENLYVYGSSVNVKNEITKMPDLQINQFALNDNKNADGESLGNGNSKIEAGESVEMTLFVQNYGFGDAGDVSAEIFLNTDNQNVSYPDKSKVYKLGKIESGDYKKIEFYFYTSARFNLQKIPFTIKLNDSKSKVSVEKTLSFEIKKSLPTLADIHISKMDIKKQTSMKKIDDVVQPSDVDKEIPKTKTDGKHTLVIIIGVEDYKYAPKVDFAKRDALAFLNYAKDVFGVPEKNIYTKTNNEATLGEFHKLFSEDGWLERRIEKDITNVIIYYAGHGAPDIKTNEAYLIPYDIDPNYAKTGFSLSKLYTTLSNYGANSVTMFIDACFSGMSRSSEMLIEGSRTVRIKPKSALLTGKNMAVFSASSGNQYSGFFQEKGHGLFTYFLLKGLKGDARGKSKKITINQLYQYILKNVIQQASILDKEQTPALETTDDERILVEY